MLNDRRQININSLVTNYDLAIQKACKISLLVKERYSRGDTFKVTYMTITSVMCWAVPPSDGKTKIYGFYSLIGELIYSFNVNSKILLF
jgi:hypothetical protein